MLEATGVLHFALSADRSCRAKCKTSNRRLRGRVLYDIQVRLQNFRSNSWPGAAAYRRSPSRWRDTSCPNPGGHVPSAFAALACSEGTRRGFASDPLAAIDEKHSRRGKTTRKSDKAVARGLSGTSGLRRLLCSGRRGWVVSETEAI